jgi:hypothetical protein
VDVTLSSKNAGEDVPVRAVAAWSALLTPQVPEGLLAPARPMRVAVTK